jgi:shikimate dehydrogenase
VSTRPTPVYAVLGRPVGRSRSPALHNAWLAATGSPGTYVALEVPEGAEDHVASAVRTLGLAGCNVTLPLKERVVSQVDALHPTAERTGAVNTLVWEGPRLVGHNTDVEGCTRALAEAGLETHGVRAVVVGAGGAARAVIEALLLGGAARIGIVARDVAAAERLVARAPSRIAVVDRAGLRDAELGVHATSGHPTALEGLVPEDLPHLGGWMDLNYWDPAPPLRSVIEQRGARFVDGWPMLVAQAAAAFRAWTGVDPLPLLRPARILVP